MKDLLYPTGQAPIVPSPRSYMAEEKAVKAEEILPVVEPSGVVVAQCLRSYAHSGSMLLHPVVHLHIISRDGSLLLQKRSSSKSLYPGMWDISVGGHVSYGETVEEALFRESSEEIDLQSFNPVYLSNFVYDAPQEKELVCLFAAVGKYDVSPVSLEVDETRYWSPDEIKENLGKSVFTPTFEYEFRRFYDTLAALL